MTLKLRSKLNVWLLSLCCSAGQGVMALEVDNFKARQASLNDEKASVDQFMDSYILDAVNKMNRSKTCDAGRFIETMYQHVGGWTTRIESDLDRSTQVSKHQPATRSSIYGSFTSFEGKLMLLKRNLGSTIRVGELYIGTDKLGHFLDTGYLYYKEYQAGGESLDRAIAWGEETEKGKYGYAVSGIYSYADLAANYEGLRFWLSFVDSSSDIKPYVSCEDGVWTKLRKFDSDEYVSAAWDEGYNCNDYAVESAREKVEAAISSLGYACPIEPAKCDEIASRFSIYERADHMISPSCK